MMKDEPKDEDDTYSPDGDAFYSFFGEDSADAGDHNIGSRQEIPYPGAEWYDFANDGVAMQTLRTHPTLTASASWQLPSSYSPAAPSYIYI